MMKLPDNTDTISTRGSASLLFLMVTSAHIITGLPTTLGQDTWIEFLISIVLIAGLMFMYARISSLMPGLNLFEMIEALFGKVISCILSAFFFLYSILAASLTFISFASFVRNTKLPFTPYVLTLLVFAIAVVFLAKGTLSALGRWSTIVTVISLVSMIFITVLSIQYMDLTNLLPMMENSLQEIFFGAVKIVPYPFGEVVILFSVLGSLAHKNTPYKTYFIGSALAYLFMFIIIFRNITILGAHAYSAYLYPSYVSTSLIKIGPFLERIEAILIFIYILGGISKAALCVISASKGMTHTLALRSYKDVIIPVTMTVVAIAAISFSNTIQSVAFISQYLFLALPFQIVIPVMVWITAEIKKRHSARPGPKANIPVSE